MILIEETYGNLFYYHVLNKKLWMTMGHTVPYWSSVKRFNNDYVIATPDDFLEEEGLDVWDVPDEDTEDYEIAIVREVRHDNPRKKK